MFTVPTGPSISAAEFTVMQILMMCRHAHRAREMLAGGDFRRHLLEGRELSGLTVGLIGLGNVGGAVAVRLAPFGCRLIGFDPAPKDAEAMARLGLERADALDKVFAAADIVSLHVRLEPSTRHLVNRDMLALMKPSAIVINTARAGIIDQAALIEALDSGRLAGAALDVIAPEPPFDLAPEAHHYDHPLLRHERVSVTPHMAGSTTDAQIRTAVDLARQLAAFFGAAVR